MANHSHLTLFLIGLAGALLGACQQKANTPPKRESSQPKQTIGNQLTLLEFRVGNVWGGGYVVRVFPDEYLVLEHKNCNQGRDKTDRRGVCVVRVDREQSERFESAMKPYRRYAVPLSTFSLEDPDHRPDGKPCRNYTTDVEMISLIWTNAQGSEIAHFYNGCDQKEFAAFL